MLSMVSQYAPITIGRMGVGGRKRVLSLSEDQQSRKRQKQLQVEPAEADRHAFRVLCFREMCLRHEDFLNSSTAVDGYLLAMASLYLKRAGLNTCGYTKDRYLFYALYLAIETEEDLPRGAEEILLYLLGPLPSSAKGEGPSLLRSTQQLEWDTRLSRFLAGKDKFWARLEYRTWVSEDKCRREMGRFSVHDQFMRKQRTQEHMLDW